eukprot:5772583-Amphidinium_carterae.1
MFTSPQAQHSNRCCPAEPACGPLSACVFSKLGTSGASVKTPTAASYACTVGNGAASDGHEQSCCHNHPAPDPADRGHTWTSHQPCRRDIPTRILPQWFD